MRIFPFLLITLTFFISTYKVLGFYFWHDDFSTFYGPRLGNCIFYWPYSTFCSIFDFLLSIFGYNPFPYFLIGVVFGLMTMLTFFILAKDLLDEKSALITSLIFATSYIASGVFLEAWDPIVSFTTLGLFFLSLHLLLKATQERIKIIFLVLSLLILGLSTFIFPPRTSTFIIAYLTAIWIFSISLNLNKKLFLSTIAVAVFLISYLIIPMSISNDHWITSFNSLIPTDINYPARIINSIKTLGSFILTDTIVQIVPVLSKYKLENFRLFIGLTLIILFTLLTLKTWGQIKLTKLRVFSFIWLISFYFPYLVRSDWRLESYHRYLLFIYPAVLFIWASFYKYRFWLVISFAFIIFYLLQSNYLFDQHLKHSKNMASFYSQLHQKLEELPKGAIIFFNISPNQRLATNDYFRVGYLPAESALGTEYQVDYNLIKLITDDLVLAQQFKSNIVDTNKIFTFYYDGNLLFNTTNNSMNLLSKQTLDITINKSTSTELTYNESLGFWTGTTADIEFQVPQLQFTIPLKMKLKIAANTLPLNLPFSQGCINCNYTSFDYQNSLKFLIFNNETIKTIKITANNSSEDTVAEYIIDNNETSSWIFNRQEWFKGAKPTLDIDFSKPTTLSGLAIISTYKNRSPKKFEVYVNGEKVEFSISYFDKGINVLFPHQDVKSIRLLITETEGNDTPTINELKLIPFDTLNLDFKLIDDIKRAPAAGIKDKRDEELLLNYLSSGANICLKWRSEKFGEGKIEFPLAANSKMQEYEILLPALGKDVPVFSISCINYPINIYLNSISILRP